MTPTKSITDLPVDILRRIAASDPRAAAGLASASRATRDALSDLTKVANAAAEGRCKPEKENVKAFQEDRARRKDRDKQVHAELVRATQIFTSGLLPVVSEIKASRRRRHSANQGNFAARALVHLALAPVIVPLRFHHRLTHLAKRKAELAEFHAVQAGERQFFEAAREELGAAIAASPGWQAARPDKR